MTEEELGEYEWEGERIRTLPDLLGPGIRLLFVGYNPSVQNANTTVTQRVNDRRR